MERAKVNNFTAHMNRKCVDEHTYTQLNWTHLSGVRGKKNENKKALNFFLLLYIFFFQAVSLFLTIYHLHSFVFLHIVEREIYI